MEKEDIKMDNNLQLIKLEDKKMICSVDHKMIKTLYDKGQSKRQISRFLGIDIKTVRRHLKKKEWLPYEREKKQTKLDPYKQWIQKRFEEVDSNARIIYRELKNLGYEGSYEILKEYVRAYRTKKVDACIRYETQPGEQAQVDWGSAWVWIGEEQKKVHFFAYTLGYSRRLYTRGYLNEKLTNFMDGHEKAFSWFGGRTEHILYDNTKTVVLSHSIDTREKKFNNKFKDFSSYYGFEIELCRPYRPQTKGKIESGVKFIKRNFLPGRRFKDLDHLNTDLEKWCLEVDQRIHGTTKQKPIDLFEEEKLTALSGMPPYHLTLFIERKVSRDARVSYESNHYSVPWIYAGSRVDISLVKDRLIIYHQGKEIAQHKKLTGKNQESLLVKHFEGLFAYYQKPGKKKTPPRYDPYWSTESEVVEVRDLGIYELIETPYEEVTKCS